MRRSNTRKAIGFPVPQAGFLESTLRQNANWRVQATAAWKERAARQSGEAKLECPPLGNLDSVLRPYQKEGVGWLSFLRENQFRRDFGR